MTILCCRVPLLDLHKLNEPDSAMEPIVSLYHYQFTVCFIVCV